MFIIGVSCSSSDDDFSPPTNTSPAPTISNPVTTPATTPEENTPAENTPPVTIPNSSPSDVIITFKADLKPDGVSTISYTTLIGNATLILNQTNKTFRLVDVGADNFNPTYVNIHTADGTIVFVFPKTVFGSTSAYISAINDAQIVELMANHYYVNFKGADGDINGQLIRVY
ncbi:hypothetical protein [Flavobacterium gilvum]|uniref:hypothetical protein n=1 Tax=Flavobacterium gilvum TaxID=1492737 RepID=UPI0012E09A8F|nr:hypothetical protein [Flavobacterium gilvum]